MAGEDRGAPAYGRGEQREEEVSERRDTRTLTSLTSTRTPGQCVKSGDGNSYGFDLQDVISIYVHV